MNLAPKKSFEVTTALASTWGRTPGSFRSRVTVTRPTRSSVTLPTRPLVTPETRIGSPSFRPLTLLNTARAVMRLVRSERPVSQNMPATNTTRPSSTIAPTPTSCLYVRSIVALAVDDGHLQVALQELGHRGVLGLQDLLARAHGADLRLPQQRDAVGHAERAAHVVRHHHAGDTDLVLQPLNQPVDHVGVHGVEPGGRLVVQQVLGLARDRAGDAAPLAHPARELGRELQRHLGGEVDEAQALPHPVGAVAVVVVARLVRDAEADVLVHAHGVEQRTGLKHVPDVGSQLGELLALEQRHVQAVHDHVARVGLDEADDVLEQHALAHAGGAEQRHGAAVVHLEVDAVQHHVVQEPLGEALELDHQPSSSLVITVSSSRMVTHEATTDWVVARPTPSAPCWVLKPR